jgi:demethylmenaquinone methyltransferase/2-methoxy-6-polyprenyl-1,4-benzoquinol methylase
MKTSDQRAAQTKGGLEEYYARRVVEYEIIYQKPERQADLQRLRSFISEAFRGRAVLEVACGTGYWTEVLASSASSVTAVDVNEEVLEIARAKKLERNIVEFVRADVYALPAFPPKYTGALAAFWWSHMPKTRLAEFLRQFHRPLRPGARVVFIDNAYVAGSSTPISRADAEGNTYQRRRLKDGSTFEVLKNFPTPEQLGKAINGHGESIRVEQLDYYWVLSYEVSSQQITRETAKWHSPQAAE